MNEKLKQRAEAWKGNFITGKISNREMLGDANIIITSLIHNAESASKREAKLVKALKQMLSLNVLHAPKSDADNYILDSVINTLSELGVK